MYFHLTKRFRVDFRHFSVSHVEAVGVALVGTEAGTGEPVGAQGLNIDLNPL